MTYKQNIVVHAFVESKFGKDAKYDVITYQKNANAQQGDVDAIRTCQLRVTLNDRTIAESARVNVVTEYGHSDLGKLLGTVEPVSTYI